MQVLVSLKFGDGDFTKGFSEIFMFTSIVDSQHSKEIEIQLPPAPLIPGLYQNWQNTYIKLFETLGIRVLTPRSVATSIDLENESFVRGFNKKISTNVFSFDKSQQECDRYANNLRAEVNQWLETLKSQLEAHFQEAKFQLDTNYQVLLQIHTQNITSQQTKDILHRLPWREWDYFQEDSGLKVEVEVVLCLSESESSSPEVKDDGKFRRVKITSIFGDSENINVASDKELIAKLQKRGAELIVLEQPQRQDFSKLWDEPCDILFYSGHSETSDDGTVGSLQINSQESLNLQEIKNTLGAAIANGLKLAIFNSCDGLGLAKQLADLRLPYIIVWREPVPDRTAIRFLEYLLNSYAKGKSLFSSLRDARLKLLELTSGSEKENLIPGLNWLPIVCKNTSDPPANWEDLGGLTGKLPDSPYKGLSAFKEEDAAIFFGRDRFIRDLVDFVKTKPLVGVVGASGSGKSSVVFAGLVPQLRATDNVYIVSFRPGKNPFDALTYALSSHVTSLVEWQKEEEIEENNRTLKELELEVDLLDDEQALYRLIENTVAFRGKKSYQRFVLIADQFEEIYTLTEQKQRQSFIDMLLYAVKFAPYFSLVLTIRADFIGKALVDYQPMGEALQKYPPILLTPMNHSELEAAIQQPAATMKVEFEKGLTSKLIDDLGNQPGRLPLLEFTLLQLWEKHHKWYLTHVAYEEIGGLEKALAKYADSVLNSLSAAEKEKAEQIFIQLIRPGEGTEDTKRVATRTDVGENNWNLVKCLADKRLVVTAWDEINRVETVEIIHEALIREWGTFRQWIQDNREFRTWQERLKQDVSDWENSNQNSEALLQGTRLAIAQDWYKQRGDELKPTEQHFISVSITRRKQQQQKQKLRRQLTIWGLTGGSLLALMLAGAAWWQWQNAHFNEIKNISVSSQALLTSEQKFEALLKSLEASRKLKQTPSVVVFHRLQEKADLQKQVDISLQNVLYQIMERNRLEKHKDEVTDVSFSPDSKVIATASKDKTVKLWSLDGKEITTLKGHKDLVSRVRFSPTGNTIATASWDGTVKLWTTEGKLIATFKENKKKLDRVYALSFSPDGRTIVTGDAGGNVKIWTTQAKLIKTFKAHDLPVLDISFSPNGSTFASASQDGMVKLWRRDGKLLRNFTGHKDWVWSVTLSPDGRKIATVSRDETIKLWSIEGKQIRTINDRTNSVTSVSFSPDGKQIVTVGADQTIKIWSESGEKLQTLRSGHKSWIWSVIFSPDGKMIATASKDGTAKLWQLRGKKYQIQQAHSDVIHSVSFSPVSGSERSAAIATPQGFGKELATASRDETVKLWKRNGELIKTFKLDNAKFTDVSFSPNEQIIATATTNGNVILWNRNGEKIRNLKGHDKKWIWQLSFSPDGKTFATAGHDGTVKLWSLDGNLLKTIEAHKGKDGKDAGANSVSFSPDGKTIATAGWDKTVKLWNREGKLIKTLTGHTDGVHSVTFSPDGRTIASASEDKTVKLWDLEGKLIRTIRGHDARVFRVRFSPDGKTIATASLDRTVKLWSLEGKKLTTYKAHDAEVSSLDFSPASPAGHTLASTDVAGKLILWNLDINSQQLLVDACDWVDGYLKNNPNVSESERNICDG